MFSYYWSTQSLLCCKCFYSHSHYGLEKWRELGAYPLIILIFIGLNFQDKVSLTFHIKILLRSLAKLWIGSYSSVVGEVTVSQNKAELPSTDCGGAGTMADVFGASPEVHMWVVLSLFSLMSAIGEKKTHIYFGVLNMSKCTSSKFLGGRINRSFETEVNSYGIKAVQLRIVNKFTRLAGQTY